jgi:hypothetical protein
MDQALGNIGVTVTYGAAIEACRSTMASPASW